MTLNQIFKSVAGNDTLYSYDQGAKIEQLAEKFNSALKDYAEIAREHFENFDEIIPPDTNIIRDAAQQGYDEIRQLYESNQITRDDMIATMNGYSNLIASSMPEITIDGADPNQLAELNAAIRTVMETSAEDVSADTFLKQEAIKDKIHGLAFRKDTALQDTLETDLTPEEVKDLKAELDSIRLATYAITRESLELFYDHGQQLDEVPDAFNTYIDYYKWEGVSREEAIKELNNEESEFYDKRPDLDRPDYLKTSNLDQGAKLTTVDTSLPAANGQDYSLTLSG